jgi:hypothetical protein
MQKRTARALDIVLDRERVDHYDGYTLLSSDPVTDLEIVAGASIEGRLARSEFAVFVSPILNVKANYYDSTTSQIASDETSDVTLAF